MDPDFLREIGVLRAGFKPFEHRVAPRRARARHVDIATARTASPLRSSDSRGSALQGAVGIALRDGVIMTLA
jgi:hypothetical protein